MGAFRERLETDSSSPELDGRGLEERGGGEKPVPEVWVEGKGIGKGRKREIKGEACEGNRIKGE